MEKEKPFQKMVLGKLDIHIQNNKIVHILSTRNGLRVNVKTQNHKARRKHIKKLLDIVFNNDSFLDKTPKILTRASGITSN